MPSAAQPVQLLEDAAPSAPARCPLGARAARPLLALGSAAMGDRDGVESRARANSGRAARAPRTRCAHQLGCGRARQRRIVSRGPITPKRWQATAPTKLLEGPGVSHRIEKVGRTGWPAPCRSGSAGSSRITFATWRAWRGRTATTLGYAWKVLTRGRVRRLRARHDRAARLDDRRHALCMTRLNLLRLNTMPALDSAALADVERAARPARTKRCASSAACRCPLLRERGDRGFRRIHWDEALRPHRGAACAPAARSASRSI